jgi:hypothetical protein
VAGSFFAVINCLTVAFGGRVQSLLTVLKLAARRGHRVFVGSGRPTGHIAATGSANSSGASAFGLAMLAALWPTTAGTICRWRPAR